MSWHLASQIGWSWQEVARLYESSKVAAHPGEEERPEGQLGLAVDRVQDSECQKSDRCEEPTG
jgi:hypothetical protein